MQPGRIAAVAAGSGAPRPAAGRALPEHPLPFLWQYVRRRSGPFGALLLLMTAAAACSIGVQYGMKLIVDTMSIGDRGHADIWKWLGLFVGLIALESALWRLGGWLGCRTVVATGVDMRLDLFRHLSGHAAGYFGEHLGGSLGTRITATAGASGAIFGALIWHIVPPVVDFLGAVVVLLTIDPWMALTLVASVAVVATAILGYGGRGKPFNLAFAREGARVNGELVDIVANMGAVKAFSARHREYRRLQEAIGLEACAQRRSWLHLEKARALHDVCLWLVAGTMLLWAVQSWRLGRSTPGDVVVVSALTFRILHGSRDLSLAVVGLAQQLGVIGEMLGVIARRYAVTDAPGAPPFVPRGGAVDLQHVTFAYPGSPPVLHDLSLYIPGGQRIGIVGPSGAGKSTLVGLIQRLDDVQSGRILVDGQPIREVTQDSLRDALAVVPQDIGLFHRSVLDNIRYGRPAATEAEVRRAARLAHCEGFVEALADGYRSLVGDRGAKLSGGQRQRIGIARAFLKDAPILMLDEATSALDSQSEQKVQLALTSLMQGRTVIAVAHRLSTVAAFDRVVVLVDGRIVEDGPPSTLRDAGGMFDELWRLQADGLRTA